MFQAIFAIPIGVALGVAYGSLAKYVPSSKDTYVTELRVLFVLAGGLFGNVFTGYFGWGGTSKLNFSIKAFISHIKCITATPNKKLL